MTEPTYSNSNDRRTNSSRTFLVSSLELVSPRWLKAACAIGRSLLRPTVIVLAWVALASASSSASSSAPGAGPVLNLSNEHLGMTLEEIEASQAGPVIESARLSPPPSAPLSAPIDVESPSELQERADSLLAVAEAAKQRALAASERAEAARLAVEAAEAGLIPGVAGNQQAAASDESCIEATIRRGVAYAESDRLCRAVFARVTE